MKAVFRVLLILVILGLVYVATMSIVKPIRFNNEKKVREKAIITRLIDIRKAQVAYKAQNGVYAANFAQLEDWLKSGKIASVRKQGELTEKQLEAGMTEAKATAIVDKAIKTGNWKEAEKEGLSHVDTDGNRVSFRRDTTWVDAKENLFGSDYNLERLGIVPGTTATFDIDTASVQSSAGYTIKVFQASVPFEAYLGDLDKNSVNNLVDRANKLEHFPGLKVGSLTEVNNNAGNWE